MLTRKPTHKNVRKSWQLDLFCCMTPKDSFPALWEGRKRGGGEKYLLVVCR